MNIERRERSWLVSMSYEERAELYADGEEPADRAVAAVAIQARISANRLHSPELRFGGDIDDVEVVIRRR